jgi:hypothetical protein
MMYMARNVVRVALDTVLGTILYLRTVWLLTVWEGTAWCNCHEMLQSLRLPQVGEKTYCLSEVCFASYVPMISDLYQVLAKL